MNDECQNDTNSFDEIVEFVNSKNIDPEIVKIVDEFFWELI